MYTRLMQGIVATVAVVLLSACDGASSPPTNQDQGGDPLPPPPVLGSIVEVAAEAGDFTTLVAALQATGLDATLADEASTFTVFAPTDAAFEALGQVTTDALLADTDTLSNILLYHVITGAAVDSITATSLFGQTVEMANGDNVAIMVEDGALKINESTVITADIVTDNGIIHVIDAVLSPPAD